MDWLAAAAQVLGSNSGSSGGGGMFNFDDMEKSYAYSGFSNNTSGFSGLSGNEIAQITASQMPFWKWGGTAGAEPGPMLAAPGGALGAPRMSWGTVAVVGAGLALVVFLLKKGR